MEMEMKEIIEEGNNLYDFLSKEFSKMAQ